MPKPEIEEFAKSLVRQVRDAAIDNCARRYDPGATSLVARRWQALAATASDAAVLVPDAVDDAVFNLLHAIDEGTLHLKFVNDSGREVDLTVEGEGELAGWYMMTGGWRAMFSEQPYVDDFADLA